jgi:hypothetical protein
MGATPIEAGDLHVVVRCPRCHERVDVGVHLAAEFKATEARSTLKATIKSKPVEHVCGQLRLENVVDADVEAVRRG